MQAGFAQINTQFGFIGAQFKKIDQRFDSLGQKIDDNHAETMEFFGAVKRDLDRLDERVGSLESSNDSLVKKANDIDNRLANVEVLAAKNEHHFYQLDLQMNKRFSEMDKRFSDMDKRFDRLEVAVFPKATRRLSLAV